MQPVGGDIRLTIESDDLDFTDVGHLYCSKWYMSNGCMNLAMTIMLLMFHVKR